MTSRAIAYRLLPECLLLPVFIVGLLFVPTPSRATTLIYQSFGSLVAEADAIILGTIDAIRSEYSPKREIYTFIALRDLEIIDGEFQDSRLVLRQLGGTVGPDNLLIQGAPVFRQGERVIVFVKGNGTNLVPVAGWNQGVFRVKQDDPLFDAVVNDYAGNSILGISGGHLLKEKNPNEKSLILEGGSPGTPDDGSTSIPVRVQSTPTHRLTLDEFKSEIRKRLALKEKAHMPLHSIPMMSFEDSSSEPWPDAPAVHDSNRSPKKQNTRNAE